MRQPIWIKITLTLLILVVSSAGGVWFGSAITPDANSAARRTKWTSLGKPPEEVVRIAGIYVCEHSSGVVVQSASGSRYMACPSGWQVWNNPSSEPWYLLACAGNPPTAYSPGFDSLPKPVRDCRLEFSNEWELAEAVYVVLEDGSVWQWKFTYGLGTMIFYWTIGLLSGLVVGIALSIWMWQAGKRSSATDELPGPGQ